VESVLSIDLIQLMIIFACLVVSAFFSGSETAITSLGSLKTKHLLEERGEAVGQLKIWLDQPARVLTTILIYNNVVNITASTVAADMALRHFESQALGIATGAVTLLVLVFGEITPKAFAKTNAEPVALVSLRVIRALYYITFPLVWAASELARLFIRWLGGNQVEAPPITEEELEFLIGVSERAGVLPDLKKEMISGIFEFDETLVREIMTPRTDIAGIDERGSAEEAIKLTLETGHSRIPVYREGIDNIVGIIFAKDLLRASLIDSANGFKITKIMRAPFFTPETRLIMDVFKDLKRTKNHMAIVVDEYGGTAGLVTMEDILEEIVGDIQDEFDTEEADIIEITPGSYDVSGSVNIDEFIEYFDIEDSIAEESRQDADTIGGWMTVHLGDIPRIGQQMTIGPLTIEIAQVARHRVDRLRVSRVESDASGQQPAP